MPDSLSTSPSLLARVRDPADADAWRQFVDLYGPLIYGLARRRGLQDADAADVTQEVLQAAARAAPRFDYDPARGRFRGWLFTVTCRQVAVSRDRLARAGAGSGDTAQWKRLEAEPARDDEAYWRRAADERVFAWAADRVKGQFAPATWRAFWLVAVEGRSGDDAARETGLSVGAVYVAKCRVLARLKEESRAADPEGDWCHE